MEELRATTVGTPLGALTVVVTSAGVVATLFEDDDREPTVDALERLLGGGLRDSPRGLAKIRAQVDAYFEGRLRAFDAPVDLRLAREGFSRRVLAVTAAIPFGELWTYGDVAAAAGSPRGGRAAGSALSRCWIELFVPCHRVVHSGGTIGGYGRHEDRKCWLIRHEGHPADRAASRTKSSTRLRVGRSAPGARR
jgi:methylated-DNA-[protein]-cysteine S-methyltransferase